MNMQSDNGLEIAERESGESCGRRDFLKMAGAGAATLALLSATSGTVFAADTLMWDKTFPQSTLVNRAGRKPGQGHTQEVPGANCSPTLG